MISMKFKEMFFDRQVVIDDMDRKTHSVFVEFGAKVRTRAKTSIRPATKFNQTSVPGQPPKSHTGLLRRMIFFLWDRATRSVIIGPEKVIGKIGDAPHALEHGGRTEVRVTTGARRRRIRIKQRPFMGPAFEKEKKGLDKLWADAR